MRGEVKDQAGNSLQNVKITHLESDIFFKTGFYGTFGITNSVPTDSFLFSKDGYESVRADLTADSFSTILLKLILPTATIVRHDNLSSFIEDLGKAEHITSVAGDETYTSLVENRFIAASRYPVTGISLNIDKASYSNIRRFINQNALVPTDAVRIEEMLNYFNLNYHEPAPDHLFDVQTKLTGCPWNKSNQLFFINVSARKINCIFN
jgi:Ca-activated chloride channel family protein